jgi:hypothetical protein
MVGAVIMRCCGDSLSEFTQKQREREDGKET